MKASTNDKEKNPAKDAAAQSASETTVIEDSGLGEVKIHENVISALVRRAALAVDGVSRLSGSALVDNIAELVGSRRMQSRAISVELAGENRVAVEIKLNVKFGYKLPEVAENVQKGIISSIEGVTGMTVTGVNVLIQEVEEPLPDPDETAETAESPTTDTILPLN